MRESKEMVTASRMQNMFLICKENIYSATEKCLFFFSFFTFRALGVESPREGANPIDNSVQLILILSHLILSILFPVAILV